MSSKSRWSKLKKALMTKRKQEISSFESCSLSEGIEVKYRKDSSEVTRTELLTAWLKKVDNTGNVKVWPAEQDLANFLIKNSKIFEGKKVWEMGAGKTGIAGVALAIKLKDKVGEIVISDGNEEWCKSIQETIDANLEEIGISKDRIKWKQIVWDENFTSDEKFDYIWMADWLFFREFHQALQ